MEHKGKCFACRKQGFMEWHHIHPQVDFGGSGPVKALCHDCHVKLEGAIRDARIVAEEEGNVIGRRDFEEIFYAFCQKAQHERALHNGIHLPHRLEKIEARGGRRPSTRFGRG